MFGLFGFWIAGSSVKSGCCGGFAGGVGEVGVTGVAVFFFEVEVSEDESVSKA